MIASSCKNNKKEGYVKKDITKKETTYFPESIKDSIQNDRLTTELQVLNEPSLLDEKDSGKIIYRFTRLSSLEGPRIFRVEKVNDSVYYFYHKTAEKRYDSLNKPEYEIVHNLKGKVYQSWYKFPFNKLDRELDSINFWNLPIDIAWNHKGGDGAVFVIEGLKGGNYHVISRWSPDGKTASFPMSNKLIDLFNYSKLYYFNK